VSGKIPLNYARGIARSFFKRPFGFRRAKNFCFISSEASEGVTGRIVDRLVSRYGKESIFIDIDNIPLGVDFRQRINEVLEQCDVMLAVIGPKWVGSIKRGGINIHRENDWVRLEVEGALKRSSLLIPVLVDNARMPKASELPDGLKDFAYRNGHSVSGGRDFHTHIDQLIRSIDRSLGLEPISPPAARDISIEQPVPATEVKRASSSVHVEQEFVIPANPVAAATVADEPDSIAIMAANMAVIEGSSGEQATGSNSLDGNAPSLEMDPIPGPMPLEELAEPGHSVVYDPVDPVRDQAENKLNEDTIPTSTDIRLGIRALAIAAFVLLPTAIWLYLTVLNR
jgi:hypothetical protein